ncbi:MAG TPA: hypothetical protein DHV28_17045 [Ignavibacteriales bacterium]|nr:hypothetical protein [Ignavibacteriales bacterium]
MKSFSVFLSVSVLCAVISFYGCNQQESNPVEGNLNTGNDDSFLAKQYNLPPVTMAELQLAKIATARYNNIENAIADGYVDINIVVPGMGHHYLKVENLNETFEIDKPEILVYSPHPVTGKMRLVAVEYAVPVILSANAPDGFTGAFDEWGVFEGDPTTPDDNLWTLHAWVWEYNPDGVFAPMNPNVQ